MAPISNPLAELRRQFLDQLPMRLEAVRAQYQGMALPAWKPAGAEAPGGQRTSWSGLLPYLLADDGEPNCWSRLHVNTSGHREENDLTWSPLQRLR